MSEPIFTRSIHLGISTRATVKVVPSTIDENTRSVDFVAATETPVPVLDRDRWEVVNEILLMDGLSLPSNKQVPFLDSHDRGSVDSVLGSFRDFRIEGGELVGKAFFSKRQKAYDAYRDVQEGHITDVSVGYSVQESVFIPEGQSFAHKGRSYTGPLKLTTAWALKEVSLTPVGADSGAKARADLESPAIKGNTGADRAEKTGGSFKMNKKLFDLLISRGLAAGSTHEQALAFMAALSSSDQDALRAEANKPEHQAPTAAPVVDLQAVQRAETAAMARAVEIMEICKAAGCESIAAGLIKRNAGMDETHRSIVQSITANANKTPTSVVIVGGQEDTEKRALAMTHGLMLRNNMSVEKPAAGHEDFRYRTLLNVAEACLNHRGIRTAGMTKSRIAELALSQRGEYAIIPGTTVDFTGICENIANKAMMIGYKEAAALWRLFCSVANLPDFKTVSRVQMSTAPGLLLKAEGAEYQWGTFSDRKEQYALGTYARKFGITRETIINDDQDAFSKVPKSFGFAGGRLIEDVVFAILTGNPVMSDGKALFHADHGNLLSGAAFSSTTQNNAMKAMSLQTDPAGNYLDIKSAICLTPVELDFLASILFTSSGSTENNQSAAVPNYFNGKIKHAASPRLSASSATAFYNLANPTECATIEVGFLDGVQEPMLVRVDQTDPDGVVFKIRHDVAAKALDWRGINKHTGAA